MKRISPIPTREMRSLELRGDKNDPCKFRRFMAQFGVEIECKENCPINCTPEVKSYTDSLYGLLLEYTYMDLGGAILFTGASIYERSKHTQ